MKKIYALGIDICYRDKSVFSLIEIQDDTIIVMNSNELTKHQTFEINRIVREPRPKRKETFSLGGGIMCDSEMNESMYKRAIKNFNKRIISNVINILELKVSPNSLAVDTPGLQTRFSFKGNIYD